MTTLTPLEQFVNNRNERAKEVTAYSALLDLVEREKECRAQIEYWRTLTGADREDERGVTAEAMKDLQALEIAIDMICKNFSIEA